MSSVSRRGAALGAIAAVALLATACGGSSSSKNSTTASGTASAKHRTQTQCGSSGCAAVRISRNLPPPAIFYGASCSGTHGDWFLNAVEGGGNQALRPSYALRWSFTPGATSARPSGLGIRVPKTQSTTVTMTLSNGTLQLRGVRKGHAPITGTGNLTVKLTGTTASPSLTFTQTGLSGAERQLGLVSPFNAGGHPLVLPIRQVKKLSGC